MFNPGRKYPNTKPRKSGWYICTVENFSNKDRYRIELHYDRNSDNFIDKKGEIMAEIFFDKIVKNNYKYQRDVFKQYVTNKTSLVKYWKKVSKPKLTGFKQIKEDIIIHE